ncbi:ParB/RepB/Spo0J family partition protein [Oceaniglobus indicus]|uniref:ParB/RepB/Spo0J family partition protein n=1 Tax=Oceaniglobus indicus TaxID=2047749 RepID=UPI000C19132D|nr:ParB/RepB/Spo0J family partition protein [Oceaniglobus indicus]
MVDKKHERRGLGRGLSALMADVGVDDRPGRDPEKAHRPADQFIPIEQIRPNPDQPRRRFSNENLDELAASIRTKGVIQPLILRRDPTAEGMFQIVAGERRWRAAQMAQLHELPAIIRDMNDLEVLEIAIIENIQRADLNPVEEASGFRQLMDRFGHTQEKLAEALGKSRSHIANLLRLLSLPEDVLDHLRSGKISAGHARALITAENPSQLAQIVIEKGLSVRQTEALAKGQTEAPKKKPSPTKVEKDADTKALELDLSETLGMTVSIDHASESGNGKLSINYGSLEDLDEICRLLSSRLTRE